MHNFTSYSYFSVFLKLSAMLFLLMTFHQQKPEDNHSFFSIIVFVFFFFISSRDLVFLHPFYLGLFDRDLILGGLMFFYFYLDLLLVVWNLSVTTLSVNPLTPKSWHVVPVCKNGCKWTYKFHPWFGSDWHFGSEPARCPPLIYELTKRSHTPSTRLKKLLQ